MKNVVMITFDSLRRDHCGFAGYEQNTTPVLNDMAETGIQFTDAIAPGPSTPESMPVIMTGSHLRECSTEYSTLLEKRREVIRDHMDQHFTLAEQFKSLGYTTAGFTPNPYTSQYFNFDKGFDHFNDFMSGSREKLYQNILDGMFKGTALGKVLPIRILLNWVQQQEVFKPWESFMDQVTDWMDSAEEPYFVWILLMDTHDPYLPPSDYRSNPSYLNYYANYQLWKQNHQPPFSEKVQELLVQAYDDTIRYADSFVGEIREYVDEESIIAVHGDHGESFGEHDLFGHQPYLYEENISTPLIVDADQSEEIDSVYPLRRLPDLLYNLALGEDIPLHDAPVLTQSHDGERKAIRAKDWKYISESSGSELYTVSSEGETLSHTGDIRELNQLLQYLLEVGQKRDEITDAAIESMLDIHNSDS